MATIRTTLTSALAALATAALLLVAAPAQAGGHTTVGTTRAWDGASNIFSFGQPNHTPTYGQTVTAPAHSRRLDTFQLIVRLQPRVRFRGYVYAWDPAEGRATGPALWQGVARRTSAYDWQRLTLYPDVPVRPTRTYVVFLTTTGVVQPAVQTDTGYFAQPQYRDLYPGGEFVFCNDTVCASDWTTQRWDGTAALGLGVEGGDLAFRATFSSS